MKKVKINFKCLEFPVGLCFVERTVGLVQLLTPHTTVTWLEGFSCQCADKCQEALAKGSDIRASCPVQLPEYRGCCQWEQGRTWGSAPRGRSGTQPAAPPGEGWAGLLRVSAKALKKHDL